MNISFEIEQDQVEIICEHFGKKRHELEPHEVRILLYKLIYGLGV